MLRTDLPIIRDLLDIGKAFPADSRERLVIGNVAEVLSGCVEALTKCHDYILSQQIYKGCGAGEEERLIAREALADAHQDHSDVAPR